MFYHKSCDSEWRRPIRWVVPLALILFMLGAVVLRYYPRPAEQPARLDSDSIVYLYMAQADWSDTALWRGVKPSAIPVLYHALGVRPDRVWVVPVFQTFFSALAWLALGLVLASTLRAWLFKIIALWFCVVMFCFPPVFGWNKCVLSESISLSWMILFVAAFIVFWRHGATVEAVCLSVTAIGFGLSRDTNALMAAVMIPCAVWSVFRAENRRSSGYPHHARRFAAGLSACFLGILLLSHWSAARAVVTDKPSYRAHPEISAFLNLCSGMDLVGRWYLPFLNVLGQRILPCPQARDYFRRRGFPLSPAVMTRSGTYAGTDHFAWYRDPELTAQVKPWIVARGRTTYISYLARYWRKALTEVYAARDTLLLPVDPDLRSYRWFLQPVCNKANKERDSYLSMAWMKYFYLNDGADLARFFIIVGLAGLAGIKWPDIRAQWGGSVLMSAHLVIVGMVIMFVVYHCDVQDRGRHSLNYVVLMNVGAAWGYFLIIDSAVAAFRRWYRNRIFCRHSDRDAENQF